jgi:alkanesulfonate monooxygenase SsuD/methylene tetrahydromethanopterin reductase-like flavin-dependent oxidoreductase (luciferase family)
MEIGLIAQLHGRPGGKLNPSWASVLALAETAEDAGFDMFVFEDALMYRGEDHTDGCWESGAIAGALAASTRRIRFGQSVLNSPYRSPTLTASMATTLDEISGGRYVLGIGAGNTDDYIEFGFADDRRFSRFAEAIHIIHGLLKNGSIEFEGDYYTVGDAELVLRGPRPQGPPINIAAGSPKMMRLVARYADAWNWWGWDESLDQIKARLTPIADQLEQACAEVGRDPSDIEKTFDLYSVVPAGFGPEGSEMKQPVAGNAREIADFILSLGDFGFTEVRCDLTEKSPAAVAAMADVVELVHEG